MNKSIRGIFYSTVLVALTSCGGNNTAKANNGESNTEQENVEITYLKREIKSTHQFIFNVKKVSGKIVKGDLFDDFDYSLYNEQGKLTEIGFLDYYFVENCFTKATTRYSYNDKGLLIRKDVTTTYHPEVKDPARNIYRKTATDYKYNETGNEVTETESDEMHNSSDNSVEKITDSIIRICKYDSKDRCIEERENSRVTETGYEEDAMGNIIKVTRLTEGETDYIEERRKYDKDNNLSETEVFEVTTDIEDGSNYENCVLRKVFNKQGDCILEMEQQENMASIYSNPSTATFMSYEYEYDEYGNWIKQISFQHHNTEKESTVDDGEIYATDDPKKRVLRIYERKIVYY